MEKVAKKDIFRQMEISVPKEGVSSLLASVWRNVTGISQNSCGNADELEPIKVTTQIEREA